MMDVLVLVQARMGSARLPGKSLKILAGRPMILHVLERAKAIGCGPVWLVTSVSDKDELLAQAAKDAGYPVYRGSEWDVLSRMDEAAKLAKAEHVMRLTGDCPLLAPDVSSEVVNLYRTGAQKMYASNDTMVSGWPDGLDTEVFPADALHEAAARSLEKPDREHVTRWIRRQRQCLVYGCTDGDYRKLKVSVDSPEDFTRVADIMACRDSGGFNWRHTKEAIRVWRERQQ